MSDTLSNRLHRVHVALANGEPFEISWDSRELLLETPTR
jgi:hypothetical protein